MVRRALSRIAIGVTHMRGLPAPLQTTHEPPRRAWQGSIRVLWDFL